MEGLPDSQPEGPFQASFSLRVLDCQSLMPHSLVLFPLEGTKLLGASVFSSVHRGPHCLLPRPKENLEDIILTLPVLSVLECLFSVELSYRPHRLT